MQGSAWQGLCHRSTALTPLSSLLPEISKAEAGDSVLTVLVVRPMGGKRAGKPFSEYKELGLAGKLRIRCLDRTCRVHLHVDQAVLWLSECLRKCGCVFSSLVTMLYTLGFQTSGWSRPVGRVVQTRDPRAAHKLAGIPLPVPSHKHSSSSSVFQALKAEQLEGAGTPRNLGTGPEAEGSLS